MVLSVA
jgi:hypothetical protein